MKDRFIANTGSYVQLVPFGLQIKLSYNSKGILKSVFSRLTGAKFNDEFMLKLTKDNLVPNRLNYLQCDCEIHGVLYTNNQIFQDLGGVPESSEDSIVNTFLKSGKNFKFYAFRLDSENMSETSITLTANRLETLGFSVLPGFYVYNDMKFSEALKRSTDTSFKNDVITGVVVYNKMTRFKYIPISLVQRKVVDVKINLEAHGYLEAKIKLDDESSLCISYTKLKELNLQPKSVIIMNKENNEILRCLQTDKRRTKPVSDELICSVCGSKIRVPKKGPTVCSNPDCLSTCYLEFHHFAKILNLEVPDFANYLEKVKSREYMNVLNLLDDDNVSKVSCTLSTLLEALISPSVYLVKSNIDQFVMLSGSTESVKYYIHNLDSLKRELDLPVVFKTKLLDWLKDEFNVELIDRALVHTKIELVESNKQFEGDPIFRGRTICIAGRFRHGNLEQISSILKSYSAQVTANFNNSVNLLLVGSLQDVSENLKELATSYNVPIVYEMDFFKEYKIDEDLKSQ